MAKKRFSAVEEQRAQYYEELVAAESRLDRLRSSDPRVNGDDSRKKAVEETSTVKEETIEEEKKSLEVQSPAVSIYDLHLCDKFYVDGY